MKISIIIFMTLLLQGCDTPQRTRPALSAPVTGAMVQGEPEENDDEDKATDDTGTNTDTGTTTGTSDPGFENCNMNFEFNGTNIGNFALCQNKNNESSFKLKMELSDTTNGTCFVPIHIESNSTSYKVGIAECVNNEANREYNMTLSKDRSESINGVMVIKSHALNSYMQCMSAKADFINAYAPNCIYNAGCLDAANNYAMTICGQFQQTYSSYYKQVPLPNQN